MESNTFKTEEELFSTRDTLLVGAVAVGLAAIAVAFAVDPFGPPVVLLTTTLVLGGLVLMLVPGGTRSFGIGLALAGAVLPVTAFAWLWFVVAAGMLDGSVS